jgi:hypothetical protein
MCCWLEIQCCQDEANFILENSATSHIDMSVNAFYPLVHLFSRKQWCHVFQTTKARLKEVE